MVFFEDVLGDRGSNTLLVLPQWPVIWGKGRGWVIGRAIMK